MFPFFGRSKEELSRNVTQGTYAIPKALDLSIEGLSFLNSCLTYKEEGRISYQELIKHPYLTDNDALKIKACHDLDFQRNIRLHLKRRDNRMDSVAMKGKNQYMDLHQHENVLYMNSREPRFF
mmetsp:Transcript_17882/g.17094  ORF Transcript_17882/g.17094 Transcript_17882/m.17094 type:complete len:123 (+) Transcript_17882:154-522(+)